jgi:glucose dehydrogenase
VKISAGTSTLEDLLMFRLCASTLALSISRGPAAVLAAEFRPVTDEALLNPDPADWLMINRTYDEQRFNPLNQINKNNVGAWRGSAAYLPPRRNRSP